MYLLAVFGSQVVHYGHFMRKYGGRRCFTLSWYILASLGENVPAGGFLFKAGTLLAIWGPNVPAENFLF